ncbi:MAG: glycoside hydrolase family 127 protein [Acidobacteria bacterium]|nr:glycoside hydrolase family 127 protein [Acidobacteriota bacterium]
MVTRRTFTQGLVGAGAGLVLGPRPGESSVSRAGAAEAVPAGELGARVTLGAERMTRGGVPAFTREFILADVALDPPRRFNEYSGDLSGRYVEALSLLPPPGGAGLDALVHDILGHQLPDGRFGDPDLRYTAAEIGGQHMAQLWGNGRLLLGLVQYHASTGDERTLAAARRLADFLTGIRAQTSDPAVVGRLLDQGAMGIICFTQLNEPLVLLAALTGESRYLDEARRIGATLGARGVQHAHGYLTTARGMVALATATRDAALLERVETLYADLVASPDLLYLGGFPEFFGGKENGKPLRDEGCAIADFLRLSLMLHRATGKTGYLERAERCLLNHLYFNQFSTGDFGHRVFFEDGIAPTESVGRAWWCCTMHGYRAYRHVLDSLVRREGSVAHVDLYQDFDWSGDGLEIAGRYRADSPLRSRFTVDVKKAARGMSLAFRRPSWAATVKVTRAAAPASADQAEGPLTAPVAAGDRVEVTFEHRAWLETRDRRTVALDDVDGESEGLLFVGPWLYAIDEGTEPLFFGEPWKRANVVLLPEVLRAPAEPVERTPFADPARHIETRYVHGGFPGEHPVTLRPVAEQTGQEPGTVATWITWRRG